MSLKHQYSLYYKVLRFSPTDQRPKQGFYRYTSIPNPLIFLKYPYSVLLSAILPMYTDCIFCQHQHYHVYQAYSRQAVFQNQNMPLNVFERFL